MGRFWQQADSGRLAQIGSISNEFKDIGTDLSRTRAGFRICQIQTDLDKFGQIWEESGRFKHIWAESGSRQIQAAWHRYKQIQVDSITVEQI